MLTLDGHSVVHALQLKQLLSAVSNSSDRKASPFASLRNSSTARMALARPRVDMISSPVATKVGHIVGAALRQPPQPLHCSRLAANESSLAANARTGSKGNLISCPAPVRRRVSILYRPSSNILPG